MGGGVSGRRSEWAEVRVGGGVSGMKSEWAEE